MQACIHDEVIDKLQDKTISDNTVEELSNLFKAMADPTRVRY